MCVWLCVLWGGGREGGREGAGQLIYTRRVQINAFIVKNGTIGCPSYVLDQKRKMRIAWSCSSASILIFKPLRISLFSVFPSSGAV